LITSNKYIPKSLQEIDKWQLSRRVFIKNIAFLGLISQIPFATSCLNSSNNEDEKYLTLSDEEIEIALKVQQILLPNDGIGPDAKKINADTYLAWVLSDKNMDIEDKNFIINGITWVNEASNKEFSMDFLKLDSHKSKLLIAKISNLDWGETWLSVMLTFVIEALLSDPIYGGNPDKIGWLWLQHTAGSPNPTKDLAYGNFLKTVGAE